RASEPIEFAFLQHTQNLRLGDRRQVGHLVEEQRAAVGQLEAALLAAGGAGEGAALVTEQLRLEQRLGQRGAVDRDERLGGTARALVDRAGEELLARATLALDQHRRRRRRHLLDEHHRATEGRAATDDGALPQQIVEALLQQLVLLDQLAALERLVDELEQLLAPERLGEEVVGAILHCLDGLLDGAE